jgi:hypothetical protein
MKNGWRKAGALLFGAAMCFCQNGYAQSKSQQKTCAKYDEVARCSSLFKEYNLQKRLIATNGASSPDDDILSDTQPFSARIYLRAAKAQIAAEVNAEVSKVEKTGEEVASQLISTSSAVNQMGASSSASGATSLVKMPTTTDLISFAAESGAFTDTVNGTTATIQGNVYGVSRYLNQIGENQGHFFASHGRFADALEPWSFTVTLNVAQSSSSTTSTATSANRTTPFSLSSIVLPSNNASFSGFSTSYSVFKKVNENDDAFKQAWSNSLNSSVVSTAETNSAATLNALVKTINAVNMMADPKVAEAYSNWHTAGENAEKNKDFDAFVAAYAAYEDACSTYILARPGAPSLALKLNDTLNAYQNAVYGAFDAARGKPLLAGTYSYSTPVQTPATHAGTVALSYLFKGKSDPNDPKVRDFWTGDQLTGNFTASWYASVPAGATYGRFRDTQLSMEFDKPFGGTVSSPIGTWSLAGYGQYQYDPTVINVTAGNLAPGTNITLPSNAQALLGTAGWTGVVQGKVVINLKQGLNIPLAIKWSNRTDLLTNANDVRGQIGVSYDLSALKSLITGSTQ